MQGLDAFEQDSTAIVFRDVIMLVLLGFVAIVLLLLPHLHPPTKTAEAALAPGNVIVEVVWPYKIDADVDLWVQAPGDRPVGYSNKGGQTFNLLRDDLGHALDSTKLNYEVSYSRGIAAGEYTVNLHLYRNDSQVFPVPVTVVVSVKRTPDSAARELLKSEIGLTHVGQEITVFRFGLGEDGVIEPGSVHSLPKPLRSDGLTRSDGLD